MDQLLNLVRREVERVLRGYPFPRLATVVSYTQGPPAAAKVALQPEGVATNWLPVASPWIGNGWGLVAPLQAGDQVLVVFPEFGRNSGVIAGRLWDQTNATLQGAAAGEFWLQHASGSFVKLLGNGHLSLNGNVEVDATGPTINITATGPVNVIGQTVAVSASQKATVTAPDIELGAQGQSLVALVLAAAWTWITTHTHSGVATGSGNTGAPNSVPTSGVLTSTIKGG